MKCELSPQAEADLLEIGDSIARDNPQRAAIVCSSALLHYFTARTEAVRIERILHGSRDIISANFLLDEFDPLG